MIFRNLVKTTTTAFDSARLGSARPVRESERGRAVTPLTESEIEITRDASDLVAARSLETKTRNVVRASVTDSFLFVKLDEDGVGDGARVAKNATVQVAQFE